MFNHALDQVFHIYSRLISITNSKYYIDTSNIPSTHIELAEKTKKRLGLGGIPPGTFQNHISTAQIQQQETLIRHSTLSYSYSIYWRVSWHYLL